MRWYRQIKSFLFGDGKSAAQAYWNGSQGFSEIRPQPALSSGMPDRRQVRLRRD